MLNQFSRTELLLGREALERLERTHVAIFGIGGVGGYVAEALVRSGVGSFTLVDDDKICLTNLNRQIIATRQTIGKYKTEVMKERILSINPQAQVNVYNCFFLPENAGDFDFTSYDYVVDAVDTQNSCRTHCVCPPGTQRTCTVRRAIPGSTSFVPSAAGLIIASEVVKDLTGIRHDKKG